MATQKYTTVKQFSKRYEAFPEGGVRHLIYHADSNGMSDAGVIVRNGRRILINEEKFFNWLERMQK